MKRSLLILAVAATLGLQAQTNKLLNVRQALVPFNGGNYNGIVADVMAPPDIVENVLKEKFAKQGVKPKEINGFLVFKNVKLESIDTAKPLDAYFKVEKRSRKESDISTISLIPAQHGDIPDEKIKSGSTAAVATMAATSGDVLNGLAPEIDMKVYEKQLADKQDEIKQGEKKLKELREDSASYVKKQAELEEDIAKSKKDQEAEKSNLEKIKNDPDATKKSVKKLDGLVSDQLKYEKKLKSTLEDLQKNKTDQELGRANLERLQKDLEGLHAKKPG